VNLGGGDTRSPVEGLEDVVQVGFVDADSPILYRDLDLGAAGCVAEPGPNSDPARVTPILRGITEQIGEALAQGVGIDGHLGQAGLKISLDLTTCRFHQRSHALQSAAHDGRHR